MLKKIIVQSAVAVLLKRMEKYVCKFLQNKARIINRIKDTVAITVDTSGIITIIT